MILKKMKNEKGISLLEVMVAMVFFAMITMSANMFMVGIVRANVATKNVSRATQVGNQILDNIRVKDYSTIGNNTQTIDSKYHCEWQVNEANNMKKILLTIKWPLDTKNHKIELSTLVAK